MILNTTNLGMESFKVFLMLTRKKNSNNLDILLFPGLIQERLHVQNSDFTGFGPEKLFCWVENIGFLNKYPSKYIQIKKSMSFHISLHPSTK